jgi:hypothetical protein
MYVTHQSQNPHLHAGENEEILLLRLRMPGNHFSVKEKFSQESTILASFFASDVWRSKSVLWNLCRRMSESCGTDISQPHRQSTDLKVLSMHRD